jgi:cell division protein FtsI (penicillin-binding protein 3)
MIKKDYKPRVLVIFLTFFVLFSVILLRLYLIQVYRKEFFGSLAQQQYEVELKINPARAKIYDRTGQPLALNKEVVSAFILPTQLSEREKTEKFLKKHFKNIYKKVRKNKERKFLWLERKLTPERLEWFKKSDIKDIHFINEYQRFYPFPATSTVVGFTDIDNVGIAGIELQFDKRLAGMPTTFTIKKDARAGHFYFEKEIKEQGKKGQPVSLTIDSKLQFLAHKELKKTVDELGAQYGSVLILNPDDGKILCMANYPDFDPNKKVVQELESTKNKIVTECYELGSVVKAFSALASLQEGVVTLDEEIDCQGKFAYIDKFRVENWKSVGVLPFTDVVRYSSNVGIAKVTKRLGPKFYTHLTRLGFGQKTDIQFPGEREGFVNPPHKWSRSSLIVMSFGYEIMATLLQLGKAFCIVANGGYDIQPILVKDPTTMQNTFRKKVYDDETIQDVKGILETIGQRYSKGLEGYRIMGKTGTARSVKDGKYSNKHHVYSFGGIVEKDKYRRVVVTFVKEPKGAGWWASQITAPLFNRVAEKMIIHDLMNN